MGVFFFSRTQTHAYIREQSEFCITAEVCLKSFKGEHLDRSLCWKHLLLLKTETIRVRARQYSVRLSFCFTLAYTSLPSLRRYLVNSSFCNLRWYCVLFSSGFFIKFFYYYLYMYSINVSNILFTLMTKNSNI